MKRIPVLFRLLALLAALALIAAACGSDDDDDGGDVATEEEAPVEEEGEAEEPAEEAAPEEEEEPAEEEPAEEEPTEEAADGTSVSFGIVEPSFIDSFNVQDSEGFEVARVLYDGLTDFDSDLNAIPAVAESWEHEDFTVWTFNLREGTTFHNGEPVTAQSFVEAFNYLASPDAASDVSYYGLVADIEGYGAALDGETDTITGLEAIDDTTLQITLNGPNPLLPSIIAHPAFSPRSQAALDDPAAALEQPVGNGAYQMAGPWEHNVLITVERFDDYYGEAGVPDVIEFRIFDGLDTMYLETQAGNLDIAEVPPEQVDAAKAEFGDRYIEVAIGTYNYLGFPVGSAPWDNADLRVALSLAADRPTITEQIFAGTRDPADGFYPPLSPGGTPGLCTNCVLDVEAAQALYEQSGGIPGDAVTVYFNTGGGHEDWLQAVANNWEQAFGITTEFVGQEFAPYLDLVQSEEGTDGPFRLGWGWDYPHAVGFIEPLFKSDSGDNLTGFNSPELDELLAQFRANEDPTGPEATDLVAQMSEILNAEMPVMPMFFGRGQQVHTDRVTNVNVTAFDFVELEKVEVVG